MADQLSAADLDEGAAIRVVAAREHMVQNEVEALLQSERDGAVELLDGSTIVTSHVEDDPRVQDPYSLRATPQVLGAVLDSISRAR